MGARPQGSEFIVPRRGEEEGGEGYEGSDETDFHLLLRLGGFDSLSHFLTGRIFLGLSPSETRVRCFLSRHPPMTVKKERERERAKRKEEMGRKKESRELLSSPPSVPTLFCLSLSLLYWGDFGVLGVGGITSKISIISPTQEIATLPQWKSIF